MTEDSVANLIAQVATQDRVAFRTLYGTTSAKLMGVLLRMLHQRSEAEDALQEVYTRVWLRAARFDAEKGRGMTWLIAIARNLAIDRLRTRKDVQTDDEGTIDLLVDQYPTAERRLIAAGEASRIATCFDTLETDRADAVRGAYLTGLSYVELALRHNVPVNTMRTWLRRSLMRLKECLDK